MQIPDLENIHVLFIYLFTTDILPYRILSNWIARLPCYWRVSQLPASFLDFHNCEQSVSEKGSWSTHSIVHGSRTAAQQPCIQEVSIRFPTGSLNDLFAHLQFTGLWSGLVTLLILTTFMTQDTI